MNHNYDFNTVHQEIYFKLPYLNHQNEVILSDIKPRTKNALKNHFNKHEKLIEISETESGNIKIKKLKSIPSFDVNLNRRKSFPFVYRED